MESLRAVASSSCSVEFPPEMHISERVLGPHSPAEHHGMEDARFVRFTDDAADVTYLGTYTAFDGPNIAQHLVKNTSNRCRVTDDRKRGNRKVRALFPRKIGGRYVALSRSDRATKSVAFLDDIRCWSHPHPIQLPTRLLEVLQLGNCGSPIEIDAGWLVLTHGVGPMRAHSLGAVLLDIDDPRHVGAHSDAPIIHPDNDTRRDGYVPNVVYSGGSFANGDTLVLPYGIGDQTIAIATLSLRERLDNMTRRPTLSQG